MSSFDLLLERNRQFASTGAHQGLSPMPLRQLFVIGCIDARVDPAHILGTDLGDALVLRNAGGRVTDGVIEEIAFIAALTENILGVDAPPFEIAVIHHTSCGTGLLADDDFRRSFAARIDADEAELAAAAVNDPLESVRRDVEKLRTSLLIPSRVAVSGHVYDIDTGLVETVVPVAVESS